MDGEPTSRSTRRNRELTRHSSTYLPSTEVQQPADTGIVIPQDKPNKQQISNTGLPVTLKVSHFKCKNTGLKINSSNYLKYYYHYYACATSEELQLCDVRMQTWCWVLVCTSSCKENLRKLPNLNLTSLNGIMIHFKKKYKRHAK